MVAFISSGLSNPSAIDCQSGSSLLARGPSTGTVHLRTWITDHHNDLGRTYANELARHYRRGSERGAR